MWRFLSRPAARATHRIARAVVGDVAAFGLPRCAVVVPAGRRPTSVVYVARRQRSPTAHVRRRRITCERRRSPAAPTSTRPPTTPARQRLEAGPPAKYVTARRPVPAISFSNRRRRGRRRAAAQLPSAQKPEEVIARPPAPRLAFCRGGRALRRDRRPSRARERVPRPTATSSTLHATTVRCASATTFTVEIASSSDFEVRLLSARCWRFTTTTLPMGSPFRLRYPPLKIARPDRSRAAPRTVEVRCEPATSRGVRRHPGLRAAIPLRCSMDPLRTGAHDL